MTNQEDSPYRIWAREISTIISEHELGSLVLSYMKKSNFNPTEYFKEGRSARWVFDLLLDSVFETTIMEME